MAKEKREKDDGAEDEGVYKEDSREDLVDDDELSPEEEGFMKGYDEADEDVEKKEEEKKEEEEGEE